MASASLKSQPGKSGPGVQPDSEENQNLEKSTRPSPAPDSKSEQVVAPPVVASAKERVPHRSGKVFLTESDKKFARKMTRDIGDRLGLNSRSRSFRVS
jgi:hypothetical protein